MFKKLRKKITKEILQSTHNHSIEIQKKIDNLALLHGKSLSNQQSLIHSNSLVDYEFKVFSEYGDDGIIQFLIKNIKIENETFIEFGVSNFLESNTRFLMMNNNWSGFVMDCSENYIKDLQSQNWYWRYDLSSKVAFVDKENVNDLLKESGFKKLGILHIDLDGNDYWILESLDLSELSPSILILEYNSVFGCDRAISTPYDKMFDRTKKHHSNLYFGASLPALEYLANLRGYAFIGCNSSGNNAYFVKKELLNDKVRAVSAKEGYFYSKFRESRNEAGMLSYKGGSDRANLIKGMEVINVLTGASEKL